MRGSRVKIKVIKVSTRLDLWRTSRWRHKRSYNRSFRLRTSSWSHKRSYYRSLSRSWRHNKETRVGRSWGQHLYLWGVRVGGRGAKGVKGGGGVIPVLEATVGGVIPVLEVTVGRAIRLWGYLRTRIEGGKVEGHGTSKQKVRE